MQNPRHACKLSSPSMGEAADPTTTYWCANLAPVSVCIHASFATHKDS